MLDYLKLGPDYKRNWYEKALEDARMEEAITSQILSHCTATPLTPTLTAHETLEAPIEGRISSFAYISASGPEILNPIPPP